MKRFFSNFLILTAIAGLLLAELPEMQTSMIRKLGPGLIQKRLEAPSVPWIIHVLEADLRHPDLHVMNLDAGALRTISEVAREREKENFTFLAAVNGDFFYANGNALNNNVMDGEIIHLEHFSSPDPVYWPAISISEDKKLNISSNYFQGNLVLSDTTLPILAVNEYPAPGSISLFNSHAGVFRLSDGMSAIRLLPLNDWALNASVYCMMDSLVPDTALLSTAPGQAYLAAADGLGETFRRYYQKGRLLKLELNLLQFEDLSDSTVSFDPLPQLQRIRHLIGGFPTIVREGENYALQGFANENGKNSFAKDRHPRTALGFNKEADKMYCVVVDGRHSSSVGIDLPDLAEIMIKLGAWRAINMDGGGSSIMLSAEAVANRPSDGRERPLRNSCAFYSSAKPGKLSRLQIEQDSLIMYKKQSLPFQISGRDESFHYKEISYNSKIDFYCDPDLGNFSVREGQLYFSSNGKPGKGYIYAKMADSLHSDSLFIHVKEFNPLILRASSSIAGLQEIVEFSVYGVSEAGDTLLLPNGVLQYSLSDSSIATIDQKGLFRGQKKGELRVIASYGDVRGEKAIKVHSREGEFIVDPVKSLDGWNLLEDAQNGLSAQIALSTREAKDKALRIDYSSLEGGRLELEKTIPLPGIPEMLMLEFRGDGQKHLISVLFEDANGKKLEVFSKSNTESGEYQNIFLDLGRLKADFPLKFKKLIIHVPEYRGRGSIYWDNLKVAYPSETRVDYRPYGENAVPAFHFEPVYPEYSAPLLRMDLEVAEREHVKLEIFNMRAERIAGLLDKEMDAGYYRISWQSPGLPCGIYFYRLQYAGNYYKGKIPFF